MTEQEKGYNGWANYETWVVNLWMDNEEGSQRYFADLAETAWADAADSKPLWSSQTRRDRAVQEMADQLKIHHEELLPDVDGFAADLLNAAMSEVDWREIAEHLVDAAIEANPEEAEEEPEPAS